MNELVKIDVSIIVPLYHGEEYILPVLTMVKNASSTFSVELIFVNDDADTTIAIPNKETCDNFSVKIIQHSCNMGIHASRIDGYRASSGTFVCFLDQDDWIDASYIKKQYDAIKECDAAICNGVWRGKKAIFDSNYLPEKIGSLDDYVMYGYPITSLGQLFVRRDAIPKEWLCNIMKNNGCDDLLLWILMLNRNAKVAVNKESLYVHVEHNCNASLNFGKMAFSIQECLEIIEKVGLCNDNVQKNVICDLERRYQKYFQYNEVCRIDKTINSEVVTEVFRNKGWQKIAVYGYGILGKLFLERIDTDYVEVMYVIDKSSQLSNERYRAVLPENDLEEVDVAIVTPVAEYDSIKRMLSEKCSWPIVSLLDIYRTCELNME